MFNVNLCFYLIANDLASLRFFYNLGHEFYQNMQASYGYDVVAMLENKVPPAFNDGLGQDGGNSLAKDFEQMDIEPQERENQAIRSRNIVIAFE